MNFAAFLVGMVGPLAARLLSALGVSLIVMTGLTASVASLKSTMLTNIGSLPSDAIMLAGLLGIWQSVGMTLGALAFCVTWASTKGFISLAKT